MCTRQRPATLQRLSNSEMPRHLGQRGSPHGSTKVWGSECFIFGKRPCNMSKALTDSRTGSQPGHCLNRLGSCRRNSIRSCNKPYILSFAR